MGMNPRAPVIQNVTRVFGPSIWYENPPNLGYSAPYWKRTGDILVSMADAKWAVLLLAHGAPDRLEDVPKFLLNVRSGRKLPEPAVQEIVHRYSLVGGGSPLASITNRQAEALAEGTKSRPTGSAL